MENIDLFLSGQKYDLTISPPLMNAAGSLGFFPETTNMGDNPKLGAFVTNPISLHARTPAGTRTCLPYPGGFLLHSGYPNPGLQVALRRFRTHWARAKLPIIVHLLVDSTDSANQIAQCFEGIEGVMAIEIGLPPEIDLHSAYELVEAASGELPLIVRLPMTRAGEMARALVGSSLNAISFAPPRGMLIDEHGKVVSGRLFGPAIFPLTLRNTREAIDSGLPVIAGGGVYEEWQVEALLAAGAQAVQLDAVFWSFNWK